MSTRQRLLWPDFLRSLAIIFVVICHTLTYEFDASQFALNSIPSQIFASTTFIIGRLGVPLFLLLSGYFLLDRSYSAEDTKKFWLTKWLPLLIVIEFWVIIYYLFNIIYNGQPFQLADFIQEILFLKPSSMNHVWYVPMILGFYLTLPFAANFLHKLKGPKILRFPMAILMFYCFIIPTINVFLAIFKFPPLVDSIFHAGFSGGAYGLYLIVGFLFKRKLFENVKALPLILLFLAGISFSSFTIIFATSYHYSYDPWYNFAPIGIAAICLFGLGSHLKSIPCPKFWHALSYYSFAIYLIHNPIRLLITPFFTIESRPIRTIALTTSVIAISWFISYVISKIPKIGKKLLYLH